MKSRSCLTLIAGALIALGIWGRPSTKAADKVEQRFREVDANRDGKVTQDELPQPRIFRAFDIDGDGIITLDETRSAVAAGRHKAVPQQESTSPEEREDKASELEIREGPKVLHPGEHGVGRFVPDLSFTDINGNRHKLSDFRDAKALVIAVTSTGCPLCRKYAPTLRDIEKTYREKGVRFIFVNPFESESIDKQKQSIEALGLTGPYVRDTDEKIVRTLAAISTTETFVLDAARTVVYRGAVDDQYGFAYALNAPRQSHLIDALDAVLAGTTPAIAATSSPGCELLLESDDKPAATAITYHNRVSRIIQANCIECHREGGIGPMPLETYEQVQDYAGMIRRVVSRGIMPPWFAAPMPHEGDADTAISHWSNDRSLSDQDKSDLYAWVKAGTPEGDPKHAPLPRSFPGGWLIGHPDVVYQFPRPIQVKATGIMPYKYVTVETDLPEDKWVQAIEIRPGDVSVVHHVIVSVRAGAGEFNERDGYWGAYVPGNSTLVYPSGIARLLPKGAKLRFQMHYTPNGTATEDNTRIGLIFAKEPPKHELRVAGIANTRINIPPGADNHREVASLRLPFNVQLLSFLPHMHLRGKAARYEVITADGPQLLLDIPRYDFNWQLLYRLAQPLSLNRGDTIQFTCWFDNSDKNPANPDPTQTVRWGQQTEDEMHLGYVEYIIPGATPGESIEGLRRTRRRQPNRNPGTKLLFKQLDADRDGNITRSEVRSRYPDNPNAAGPIFDRLDTNRNGSIDQSEFDRLRQTLRQ